MKTNPNTTRLPEGMTASEVMQLPLIDIMVGGIQQTVRYDESRNLIFLLDRYGQVINYAEVKPQEIVCLRGDNFQNKETGKNDSSNQRKEVENPEFFPNSRFGKGLPDDMPDVGSQELPQMKDDEEEKAEVTAKITEADTVPEISGIMGPDTEEEKQNGKMDSGTEKAPKKKKWVKTLLVGLLLTMMIGGGVLIGGFVLAHRNNPSIQAPSEPVVTTIPAPATNPTTVAAETEPAETTEPAIMVLQSKMMLLPGHQISDADFDLVPMSADQFKNLNVTGGIYTADELARLSGLVVISYIPDGKYLGYADVSTSYSPTNPWGRTTDRQELLTFKVEVTPESLSKYMMGNLADMVITVKTKVSTPVAPTEAEENTGVSDGVNHTGQSIEMTKVDTYEITAPIVDVLNVDRNSLFGRYKAIASIPVPFREESMFEIYPSVEALEADIPAYIVVAVPVEQAKLFNTCAPESISVEVVDSTQNATTDAQTEAFSAVQELATVYSRLWTSFNALEPTEEE